MLPPTCLGTTARGSEAESFLTFGSFLGVLVPDERVDPSGAWLCLLLAVPHQLTR